ncbi:hypothetical protein HK100_007641 [Physocladia obscura]|uniref:Hemerythrin-like domain-containing protein n=1 Tax=Physocladia obscura TaxID=109957 RepID=A0AAD5SRF1_9FUNG|nr:hypothetical protein HK100_007641 [Physocladia obscura]
MSNTNKPDSFDRNHIVLLAVHNTLRRSLHQSIINCDKTYVPDKKTLRNFLGFVDAAMQHLHNHHTNEDVIYFPVLAQHGIKIDHLDADHHALIPKMKEIDAVVKVDKRAFDNLEYNTFDFVSLKTNLEKLRDILLPHLDQEEREHAPDILRASGMSAQELDNVLGGIVKAEQKLDPTISLPIIYYHLDEKEIKEFWEPTIPAVVRVGLFSMFACWNSGFWEFSYAKAKKP